MATRRVWLSLALCLTVFWAGAWALRAQTAKLGRIVSNVELVQVPVVIFDDKGQIAANLTKDDFRLFDDGVEQEILYFERERVPISFVIVADLSSSMTSKIPFVQQAALSVLYPPEGKDRSCDEYSVLSIGSRSQRLIPFTCDQEDLQRRLPLLLMPTHERTALLDTVWLGVNTAELDAANQRRAMIIITDGGDNHSRYSLRQTKKLLEEADMPVFAVMAGPEFELPKFLHPQEKVSLPKLPSGLGSRGPFPNITVTRTDDSIGPAERRGPYNMKALAEASGGAVFTAMHESDLPRIVRTIGLAVRYRYILTYKPAQDQAAKHTQLNAPGNGNLHKIHLELYPKEKFAGYSVPYYKSTYHTIP